MTRVNFDGTVYTPTPHHPRDRLNDLAAAFESRFEAGTLRSMLTDATNLPGEAWDEVRDALRDAVTAAEAPEPPRPEPIGTPVPEGTRVLLYSDPGETEPAAVVTADADGLVRLPDGEPMVYLKVDRPG
ncbi:hypothetical protein [Micromonospora sp. NPDC005174]|uniref:hypothetical protein n=1 Tax=Micromonospora sp. NPDC005174 TaxID=3157018 RepID=UPI0033B2B069